MGLSRSSFIWLVPSAHFTLYMFSNLSCYLIFLYLWSIFPNMFPTPGCVWLLLSTSLSGRSHFPSVMSIAAVTMMGKSILPSPFPIPLSSFRAHYSNGAAQKLLDAAAKCYFHSRYNMWHCWQFLPSSQICSPWLPWVSSWSSSRPSALVNSVTSWAYSCWRVLITSW